MHYLVTMPRFFAPKSVSSMTSSTASRLNIGPKTARTSVSSASRPPSTVSSSTASRLNIGKTKTNSTITSSSNTPSTSKSYYTAHETPRSTTPITPHNYNWKPPAPFKAAPQAKSIKITKSPIPKRQQTLYQIRKKQRGASWDTTNKHKDNMKQRAMRLRTKENTSPKDAVIPKNVKRTRTGHALEKFKKKLGDKSSLKRTYEKLKNKHPKLLKAAKFGFRYGLPLATAAHEWLRKDKEDENSGNSHRGSFVNPYRIRPYAMGIKKRALKLTKV